MEQYDGHNSYKEQWLAVRLQETFGDASQFTEDMVYWLWDYCMMRLQYRDIDDSTSDEIKQAAWDRVLYYLKYDLKVLNLMSQVTVTRND